MPFSCAHCGEEAAARPRCGACGGFVHYRERDPDRLREAVHGDFAAALPPYEPFPRLGQGDTPTVEIDGFDVTVVGKLESLNPTCSFKDRGSALATATVADEATDLEGVVVASTGNTATSVAAYAARLDVPCAVLVPDGVSTSKLGQAAAHGADLFAVDGSFSDCFRLADAASGDRLLNGTAVYSANPFVASANRTVAFELVDQLGVPDWVTVPVGAGPLLGGTYRGFLDLYEAGLTDSVPGMVCVQARGCHPIVRAFRRDETVTAWTDPVETSVGAIADPLVGYAADGEHTREAVVDSDGTAVALADERFHEWADRLAERHGIYAEPASAGAVAAVEAVPEIEPDDTVAALVTGHGLKEGSETAPTMTRVDEDATAVREALLG